MYLIGGDGGGKLLLFFTPTMAFGGSITGKLDNFALVFDFPILLCLTGGSDGGSGLSSRHESFFGRDIALFYFMQHVYCSGATTPL